MDNFDNKYVAPDVPSYGIKNTEELARATIDVSSRFSGLGGAGTSTFSIINGLSIYGGLPKIPSNTDNQGYTFFTRPQLNLSYNNCITSRRMAAYANQNPVGAANAIRCMLQPIGLMRQFKRDSFNGSAQAKSGSDTDIRSQIVDDRSPFINLLSNTLMTINGFPDLAPDTYTSNEGIAKEVVSWVDDRPYQHGPFDITADFANMDGDMLTHFFHCWVEYETRVAEGSMVPFPINIMTNRIDYQTKIYRLTMDRTRKFVQNIATTIAYPTAVPLGAVFNFNLEERLATDVAKVSIQFRCVGVEYNDPIQIYEFNRLVSRFNPDMADPVDRNEPIDSIRNKKMIKINESEKLVLDYKCYPRISETNELEWWTPISTYNEILAVIKRARSL